MIEARLITYDEIKDNFGFEDFKPCGDECGVVMEQISSEYSWLNCPGYQCWTMSDAEQNQAKITIYSSGPFGNASVNANFLLVRPVITIPKSYISS